MLFWIGNHNFLTAYNLNTIFGYAVLLLLVGLGQMCAILVGGIDLSVGGIMSFVSVVFVTSIGHLGYWAYPPGILIRIGVGYINGNILTRIRIPSFIATLGIGGVLMSLAMLVAPVPINVPATLWKLLDIFNGSILKVSNVLYIGLITLLLYTVILRFRAMGRNLYYVGSNIKMSWMSGIDIVKSRNIAFMLSGFGAAMSGILVSAVQLGCNPYVGAPYVLTSVAAVVVGGTALTGGIGGPINTLFGALTVSVLQNGMTVVGVSRAHRGGERWNTVTWARPGLRFPPFHSPRRRSAGTPARRRLGPSSTATARAAATTSTSPTPTTAGSRSG